MVATRLHDDAAACASQARALPPLHPQQRPAWANRHPAANQDAVPAAQASHPIAALPIELAAQICNSLTLPLLLFDDHAGVIWCNESGRQLTKAHATKGGRLTLILDVQRRLKHHIRSARWWPSDRIEIADSIPGKVAAELVRFIVGKSVFVIGVIHPAESTSSVALRKRLTNFGLTPTEQEVAEQMLAGRTTSEIAQINAITLQTVRTHIKRIYYKMGVHCREKMISKLYSSQ
jgi:DNA-binding CsgD family transcriptional regulator